MTTDEQQIRDLVAKWLAATRAGDMAAVLPLMTDDVVFLVPGQEPFGREVFAAAARASSSSTPLPQIDGRSEIQEIQVEGTLACLYTKLSVEVTPPNGGKVVRRAGYTLTVLRKVGGQWRIARDANLLMSVGS
jgi:uncharacterized protein (TIGR02246 family)